MNIEQATQLMYEIEHKKIIISLAIEDLKFVKEYIKDEAIRSYIDRRVEQLATETYQTKGEKNEGIS